ncbi:hypothetical protein F4821DRAFT_129464 [Hypoxylon rubiginosum]|uniref:Uncharacterized protein n=1 Tax=Hypoxylon rubiginosum TaxID=110542 RepID=A0ACC0D143_9PEZI|nr:hypothetical protein F4821DRAFT_129464 [Hypoxylon rubiginosum]
MSPSKQEENVEEEQAFLPPAPPRRDTAWSQDGRPGKVTPYLRLAMEIAMAAIIIVLLVSPVYERIGPERSPVPRFPRKTYTFLPDPQYVRDDMLFDEHNTLHTLHNWIPLSADARGYVQIPDYDTYDMLSDPYTVAINRTSDGPAYMMSVFHQLHCLSYLVDHFQQGYAGTELTDEVAHHSAHCIDYIRQSIMCAADTNLEGKTEAGPGWGSKHECADYDAVLAWANEHSTMKWRNGLMPGEAIL